MGWKKGSGIERKVNRGFVFSRFRVVNRMSSVSRKKEKKEREREREGWRGKEYEDTVEGKTIENLSGHSSLYREIIIRKLVFQDNYSRNTISGREKYIYIFPEEFYSQNIIVRGIDLEGGRSLGVLPINVKLIRMSCRSLNKINMAAVNV